MTFWPTFLGEMSVYRLVLMSNMISINGSLSLDHFNKFMSSKYTSVVMVQAGIHRHFWSRFLLLLRDVFGLVFL